MIIHCIGTYPHIDFQELPYSVVVRTAYTRSSQTRVVKMMRHSFRPGAERKAVEPITEESVTDYRSDGLVAMTRLLVFRGREDGYGVFIVPMADSLKVRSVKMVMVVIKHSHPNSFVWVDEFKEAAAHMFLKGENPDCGSVVLLHRDYDPFNMDQITGERTWKRRSSRGTTAWEHLVSDD